MRTERMSINFYDTAMDFISRGLSIIPVKQVDKKPYTEWKEYQTRYPTEAEVKKWVTDYPKAQIAIVTGKISNLTVIDCDTDAGIEALGYFLDEDISIPTVKTPRGMHYYFKHDSRVLNSVKTITDTDTRSEGGYVLAPPSHNGAGPYKWLKGLSLDDVAPGKLPENVIEILSQHSSTKSTSENEHDSTRYASERSREHINERTFMGNKEHNKKAESDQSQAGAKTDSTNCNNDEKNKSGSNSEHNKAYQKHNINATKHNKHNIDFTEGARGDSIFHIANCLIKGGMSWDNVEKAALFLSARCSPPFPEKETLAAVKSAISRNDKRQGSLTGDIREWLDATWGNISVTDALQNITNITNSVSDKNKVRVILHRFVEEGFLEKVSGKNGVFRKVENQCDSIDPFSASAEPVRIWMPFKLHDIVNILPGNIIVIAGEPDAGKTAFLMAFAKENARKHMVHYFSSEMGPAELLTRIKKDPETPREVWKKIDFKERSSGFQDVIKPGEGHINIIDFLEISMNFYEISGRLKEIHDKLKGAIAVIALQKNPGVETGLGGFRGMEKPRLYLTMSRKNVACIVKAKNWASERNPNGLTLNYKIVDGYQLLPQCDWRREISQ